MNKDLFNVQTTHPLIQRKQTYVLHRKLVSIHSDDRDLNKWPEANNFEVELGENFKNVQSIRLIQFSLPNNNYVFSNSYKNTQLAFTYTDLSGVDYPNMADSSYNTIKLSEGTYSENNLATALQSLMNETIFNDTSNVTYLPSDNKNDTEGIKPFVVKYNEISNKLLFGASEGKFNLNFDEKLEYKKACRENNTVFDQNTKWGLPYYLGFDKEKYEAKATDISNVIDAYMHDVSGLFLDHEYPVPWIKPTGHKSKSGGGIHLSISNETIYSLEAPYNLDIYGEDTIYMEMDKYNCIDENVPYSSKTTQFYNIDSSYKVYGSFAKISLTKKPFTRESASRNEFISNVFHSEPPVQKINKLKFKFRYHDGRLVDFNNSSFNFTLEFNMLRDEQMRSKNIRIPLFYTL